ncbi:MAG TPA: sigma-54 dependent transcriptional regulator [Saprospiraceae bacterium]|nr:sigma-54 dependent transcriptional regulator [Saprospiraceae bacterium]
MPHILIVDDDRSVCYSIRLLLKRAGMSTAIVHNARDLEQTIEEEQPDLVLLDMNFTIETSGDQGLKALDRIRTFRPALPVILMTGWATVDLAVRGMKKGAKDFVAKPWDNKQLLSSIRTILSLTGKNEASPDAPAISNFDRIIGSKNSLKNLVEKARRIAPTDASVLILGESGTGKELMAEAIHQGSQRADAPFVRVNMGGIPASLFESEMFGHKKGAFTDASADRDGRFKMADGGTIFLDEIGDLPMESQVKLLRILQEKTFEPLGSSRTERVDVRVISATNKNLEKMVAEGIFREDLYYRINLITIELPPLRDRKGDIPLLIQDMLQRMASNYGLVSTSVDEAAINWLQRQHFSGNIRQLKNLVERSVLLSGKSNLSLEDFRPHYQDFDTPADRLPKVGSLSLEEMEVRMIQKALEYHQYNISATSKSLGLTRSALYRRLQKYQIPHEHKD